jgi:hypothetical protein
MEKEPLLFLVFQYQFNDEPSMIKKHYIYTHIKEDKTVKDNDDSPWS